MKTVYAAQTVWSGDLGHAVGETGRGAGVRLCAAGAGKVIDMAAWKAENLVGPEELEELGSGLGSYEGRELVRRRRRKHEIARVKCELAATLSVVAVMAALVLRVLMF